MTCKPKDAVRSVRCDGRATRAARVLRLRTLGPAETRRVGRELGRHAWNGQTFFLIGEYGSGKTQLVKGLAAGLGVKNAARVVTSPTFVLHNIYNGRLRLHHVDAHRLRSEQEFESIGWPELFSQDVTVIEWADRVFPRLKPRAGRGVGHCPLIHVKAPGRKSDKACRTRAGCDAGSSTPIGILGARLRRLLSTSNQQRARGSASATVVTLAHAGPKTRDISIGMTKFQ